MTIAAMSTQSRLLNHLSREVLLERRSEPMVAVVQS